MKPHVDDVADRAVDPQLFAQLAPERVCRILARLHFAAGKLPHPGEVRALLPLGEQDPPVLDQDPRRHDYRSHGASVPQQPAKDGENPPAKG